MRTWLSRLLEFFDATLARRAARREKSRRISTCSPTSTSRAACRARKRSLAARKSFGGVDQIKERYRDQRGLPFFDMLVQDVRFAFRLMRKNAAFSLTAAGSLALSIGALTLAFCRRQRLRLQAAADRRSRRACTSCRTARRLVVSGLPRSARSSRRRGARRLSHLDDERRARAGAGDPVGLSRHRQLLRGPRHHAGGRTLLHAERGHRARAMRRSR